MNVGDIIGRAEVLELDEQGNAIKVKVPFAGDNGQPLVLTLSYGATRAILELLFPAL